MKNVLICGASGGIGLSTVKKFLSEGYRVFVTSRRKSEITSENLYFFEADFYDNNSIEKVCTEILNKSDGRLDAVINCVGDIITGNKIKEFETDLLYKTFQINFFSSFILSKYLFEAIASNKGCFVFLSSVAREKVYPDISDYCASKAALSNFVKSLAIELAPYKARAVAVSPAVVNTPLFEKSAYTKEEAGSWHKLSRIGEPDEIAELIFFLARPNAGWITGGDYIIDGGMLL